ncbi:cordon-bleu protein-like 1 isoform X2 [Pseudorasbora parva]|uniref:cordon-bleu protein-like 1 isoform X2 n=1 Tax=Pseudorasbora parva TaxID=51549 RepID=UPI00351EDD0C
MDAQEDLLDRDIPLTVLLPGGQETTAAVHGSKPVMDVLVTLCAQHHLIPSDHVIKLISTNQNHINFKPNSMIGSLEFERVVLQTKGSDANKKKPHIPLATVRLLVNYKKSHKAVVRVDPTVPLIELMPTVCEKCEFNPDATILLKTDQSEEPLDLAKTLNDYGIRELYAKEMKAAEEEQQKTPVNEKNQRDKGNKGFFGLFKKSKKTPEQAATDSASTSPELSGQCVDRVNGLNGHSNLPIVPADMPKKRRAPQPPMTASQSVASGLHTRDYSDLSESDPAGKQGLLSRISSTESSLKRTKRRAPPPPCDGPATSDKDNKDEAQGSKRSDKYRAHIADRCPAITKVMSELVESLQARQQRTLSSANSSISQNQPAEDRSPGLFSEHHTPEAELKALPDCQLLRSPSVREGLTSFTVIPQRRQQSMQCFEVPLTLQSPDATKPEKDLFPGDPDSLENSTTEPLEEGQSELFRSGGKGSDKSEHVSEVLHVQHLEKENQAWTDIEDENFELKEEEDLCIHPKNIELESFESLPRGQSNLEDLDDQMHNLQLRDSWACPSKLAELSDGSPIDPNTGSVEPEEMEEHASVETEEDQDWVEQYKERRSKFLDGDNDGIKQFDVWGRIQREFTNVQEMDFPSPPPPVHWNVNCGEYIEDIENGREQELQSCDEDLDKWANADMSANSKPKYVTYPHYSKPKTSGAENNCSFTPEPHNPSFLSKSQSSFDPCPPAAASLFALAVFQKAKRSKPGLDPNCSRRRELPMHTHSN